MTQQTSPFLEGKFGWALGESNWNLGMDDNLLKFSYMFDKNIDGIVSSLPAAVNGTAYFNTTDNRIHYVVNGSYSSTPVPQWFLITLRATGVVYQFNGTTLDIYRVDSDKINYQPEGVASETRTVDDKFRDFGPTVLDFMTDAEKADARSGTPVLNHAGAFNKLITAMGSVPGRSINPGLSYRLDSNVIGTTATVLEFDVDATFVGTGIFFGMQTVYNKTSDTRRNISGAPNAGTIQAVSEYLRLTNTSTEPGYGHRQDYIHTGTLASGFSLGKGNVCVWQSIVNGASGQAQWTVATTPTNASGGSWGVVCEEMNIMNRGPDTGYQKRRGVNVRWSGGIQIVPEADDLAGGTGNICRNSLFAFCTAHSVNLNDLGLTVKTYNGLLVEQDSIAPAGRGALFSGDTSTVLASRPFAAIEIDQLWTAGIEFQGATFTNNVAIDLGATHKINWGNLGTSINSVAGSIRFDSAVSTNVEVNPGGITAARFSYVATAVNFLNMFGNIAGAAPNIGAAGADANIDIQISPKGTGVLNYNKAAVAATTPANFTATHMVDIKLNGVAYKIPARVAAW